ncbi:uncharacterized protein G2W53_039179 [Senna tora]|uniref:Uncharacterized protein n=1 Tax=Senna tora TaxID=362788 RepID=A0A834W393_9FABA|nr:uncharacterized protein G2W53_039179 [Senna tora]
MVINEAHGTLLSKTILAILDLRFSQRTCGSVVVAMYIGVSLPLETDNHRLKEMESIG